jgi:CTP synthase (UTP-ammonia lyase)
MHYKKAGLKAWVNPDTGLVVEIDGSSFFIGVQYHPE